MKNTKETHYVYKITNLNPIDEEQYYIGVRTSKDCSPIEDEYMGSSEYLDEAIHNQGLQNFKKDILSVWDTREAAHLEEVRLHEINDVAKNPIYYNRIIASINGYNPVGNKQSVEKMLITRNNIIWKETVGKEQIIKYKETVNSEEWKQTTGQQKISKNLAIRTKTNNDGLSSYDIGTNNGKITRSIIQENGLTQYQMIGQKISMTKQSKEWQETVGLATRKKQSDIAISQGRNKKEKNINAKLIHICDADGEVMFVSHGEFLAICNKNNLPIDALKTSIKNNGAKIFQTQRAKTRAINSNKSEFIGWSAKLIVK